MKSSKAILVIIIGLLAMMITSCSSETEKKLNGRWLCLQEEAGAELVLGLTLDHESGDGLIEWTLNGVDKPELPIFWTADENEMSVSIHVDDVKWGHIDPALQLIVLASFGAGSDGEAEWPIVSLTEDAVMLNIAGSQYEFDRFSKEIE